MDGWMENSFKQMVLKDVPDKGVEGTAMRLGPAPTLEL